jgi:hypothetical protein
MKQKGYYTEQLQSSRYLDIVRREAWHVLDHIWEIEDRTA